MALGIKSGLDMSKLDESKKLFEKHLKELQKMANENPIKINIENINKDIDKLNEKIKSVGNNIKGTSESFKGLGSSMGVLAEFYARWLSVTTLINESINAIKGGISEIKQIDSANVRIAMIKNDSVENIAKMNGELMQMSLRLGELNSQTMNGFESWARSGIEDTKEINRNLETTSKLARIAGEDNGKMADSLIIIKNAYDLNSQALEGYASKVAKLDNSSATSSKKINDAMMSSAETFKSMGVDMDIALSWITNFSEKSAMSGNSIGNHFKSLMTNFHKYQETVKNGSGEEVNAFNKIEQMLIEKGIYLRKSKDQWNDLGTVISNIQKNIGKFTEVDLSKLSFAIGGKENMEMTLSTLKNMERINQLQNDLKDDSGAKALNEAHSKYIDSIEYKTNNLKNQMTKMWMELINSSTIKTGVDGLSRLVQMVSWLANEGRITTVVMGSLALAIANIGKLQGAIQAVTDSIMLMKAGMFSLNFNPIILAISAIGVAVGYVAYKHSVAKEQMEKDISDLKSAYESLNESIKNIETVNAGDKRLKAMEDSVGKAIKLKEELAEVEKKLADAQKAKENHENQPENYKELIQQQRDLTKSIAEQDDVMQKAGVTIDDYNNLKFKMQNINLANTIKEEAKAEWDNRESVQSLFNEYNNLINAESKSEDSKKRLSQVSNELQSKVKGLTTTINEDGTVRITNTSLISKQVEALNKEGLTLEGLQNVRMEDARNHYVAEKTKTECTYQEVKNRILMMQKEYDAAMDNMNPRMNFLSSKWKDGTITTEENEELNNLTRGAMYTSSMYSGAISKAKGIVAEVDEIFKTGGSNAPNIPSGSGGFTPSVDDSKKSGKTKQEIEDYKLKNDLTKDEEQLQKNLNREKEKANLLTEKANIKEQISLKQRQIDLAIQESTNDDKIYQKKLQQFNDVKSLLGIFKFNVDDNGQVTNAQDRLKEMTTYANSLTDNKAKKEHIEQIKDLENEINKLYDLGNALQDTSKKKMELTNQVSKLNKEIMNLKIDELTNKFNEANLKSKGQLDDLDLKELKLDSEDLDGSLNILNERKLLVQEQINAKLEELEALTHISVANEEDKKALDKKYREEQNALRELQKVHAGFENSIKDNYKKRLDVAKDIESKITDMFKKQVEERKKAIEQEYDKRVEYFNKVKKLYNQENNETDRNKELNESQGDLDKLRNDYQTSLRDNSEAGQLKTEQLRKAIEDQEKKINDLITKQERDRYNESLDNKISELEEKKKSELKSVDDTWTPSKIAEMVKQAMADGTFKDLKGNIISVKDAYSEFLDKFENGMSMSGKKLKDDFIKNFDIATESVKETDSTIQTLTNTSKTFTSMLDTGLNVVSETINNKIIPDFEKLRDIIGKVDMSNLGIGGISSTKVMMPSMTNISSIANNISNVRNQPVSLKTDVNVDFGGVATSMTTKDFVSKAKQCKNEITEAVTSVLQRQLLV